MFFFFSLRRSRWLLSFFFGSLFEEKMSQRHGDFLTNLQMDCLSHILSFLPTTLAVWLQLRVLNKSFWEASKCSREFNEHLAPILGPAHWKFMSKFPRCLRALTLELPKGSYCHDAVLHRVQEKFPGLEELSLFTIYPQDALPSFGGFSGLRSLKAQTFSFDDLMLLNVVQHCPLLEHFRFRGSKMTDIGLGLLGRTPLKTLAITQWSFWTTGYGFRGWRSFSLLESLSIQFDLSLKERDIRDILLSTVSFHRLTHLCLSPYLGLFMRLRNQSTLRWTQAHMDALPPSTTQLTLRGWDISLPAAPDTLQCPAHLREFDCFVCRWNTKRVRIRGHKKMDRLYLQLFGSVNTVQLCDFRSASLGGDAPREAILYLTNVGTFSCPSGFAGSIFSETIGHKRKHPA